jgi:hypothetical protein
MLLLLLLLWLVAEKAPGRSRSTSFPKATGRLHAHIIQICSGTFDSCPGMLLLLWLLCCRCQLGEGRAEPGSHPYFPSQLVVCTSPTCSNHSNMFFDFCFMLGYVFAAVIVAAD